MKLTRRQEEFFEILLDLHKELEGPIHYSLLAERLGISPFTAYDMLCVLEEKGYVTSAYHLAQDKSGPGRAERVFYPSETTREREQRLAEQVGGEDLSGEALKEHIMQKLRSGDIWDVDFAEELLARIPPQGTGRVRYCVEVMTIISLRLRHGESKELFKEYFPEILPTGSDSCRAHLTMLGGFVVGLLAQECALDQAWVLKLLEHVQQYQDIVIKLSPAECRKLADYLLTVFREV